MITVSKALLADKRGTRLDEQLTLASRPVLRYIGLVTFSARESVVARGGTRDTNDPAMCITASTIGEEHISPVLSASSHAKAR